MGEKSTVDALVRVEVSAEPIIPGRSGANDRGPWSIPAKQVCYVHQGATYPVRLEVPVPDSGPYRPGFYLLAGSIFFVGVSGQYTRTQFDERQIALVPIDEAVSLLSKSPAAKAA